MRKMWSLILVPLLALAMSAATGSPANAFGSEALGCSIDPGQTTWTAGSCSTTVEAAGWTSEFAVHNLSGTYSYAWHVTNLAGYSITNSCTNSPYPCLVAGTCIATSSVCEVEVAAAIHAKGQIATVVLTQSGLKRTLTARADEPAVPDSGGGGGCPTC